MLALRGEPQEQPRERDDRDERALDHHHAAREALVVERGHPERPRRVLVERVEDGVRPDEDVAEHGRDDADDGDVAELRARAEPLRHRHRLEHGQSTSGSRRVKKHDVLERVHGVVPQRRLVEERQVPHVEVERPERRARRTDGRCAAAGARSEAADAAPARSARRAARAARGRRAGCAASCGSRTSARRSSRSARRGRRAAARSRARRGTIRQPGGAVPRSPQRPHALRVERREQQHGHDLQRLERPVRHDVRV